MRPAALFSFASMAMSILSSSVGAAPRSAPNMVTARVAANAAALRFGKSVGSPTEGHLLGGSRLEDTPYLHVLPHDVPGDVRWGLTPLVTMIDHGARMVQKKFPGAVLEVGHLSRAGGGDVGDHASHESGRDADIAYYVKNNLEKQVFSDQMVRFRGDGTAPSWPGAKFDDAKNWLLISSFVQDSQANVTYIFVAAPIRARLLAYAEKIGAAPAIRDRAAMLMMQPHGSLPHDDHFHVRIGCPAGQRECVENPAPRRKPLLGKVPKPKKRERSAPPPPPKDGASDSPIIERSPTKIDESSSDPATPATNTEEPQAPQTPANTGQPGPGTAAVLSAPNDTTDGPVEGD